MDDCEIKSKVPPAVGVACAVRETIASSAPFRRFGLAIRPTGEIVGRTGTKVVNNLKKLSDYDPIVSPYQFSIPFSRGQEFSR